MANPSNNYYFEKSKSLGFHPQFMRNMLFLNQGNYGVNNPNNSIPRFSEIGQFADIHHTDWSWSPLIADFDNDGKKDIFISNGYLRDITDLDFITGNIAFAEKNQGQNMFKEGRRIVNEVADAAEKNIDEMVNKSPRSKKKD